MLSKNRKKIKSVIFCFLFVIIMIFLLYYTIWPKYLKDRVSFMIHGQQEDNMDTNIFINDTKLPFDVKTNTYYYSVRSEDEGKNISLNIRLDTNKPTKNKIEDKVFEESITINTKVDFSKKIEINSESKYFFNKCYIEFTNLPTISIDSNYKDVSDDYVFSSINIINPNFNKDKSQYEIISKMKVRIRGNSGRTAAKKSYRVELYDDIYDNKNNISLLGLREDSDWILDSLYADISKIRNVLAYDMWTKINEDVDDKYKVNLKGEFVELFMDNEYRGLYVLKEPIDKKTLDLKTTTTLDSGILIKGIDHNLSKFKDEEIKSNKGDSYYDFELKYPKKINDNTIYWSKILSKMKPYYTGNITDDVINNTFYLDNFINYRLFVTAISASDNYEPKNVYLSLRNMNDNTKILLTPWDLDLTFGLEWSGGLPKFENIKEIIPINTGTANNYKNKLKERWKYLRKNVFNEKITNDFIDNYYKKLTLANAIGREDEKWGKSELKLEIENMKKWCKDRYIIIDEYINNL